MKSDKPARWMAIIFLSTISIGCTSQSINSKTPAPPLPSPVTSEKTTGTTKPEVFTPLSPYSTEGLLALNEFRTSNASLNDFLLRNRKPDYFFSGANSNFSYQKIYLVYLESENLYLFDPELAEPYKKFHPLPDSIKESLKSVASKETDHQAELANNNTQPIVQSAPQQDNSQLGHQASIEKSLTLAKLEPYLYPQLLYAVPTDNETAAIYPDLYFLDKPLTELLENDYSAKYDDKKQTLKLIFPKSYEIETLYKKSAIETRKLFVIRPLNNSDAPSGSELSLIVPDFLPGSSLYQTTHGTMTRVFSSLYQVKVPQDFSDIHRLHMRYSIKLCQADTVKHCAVATNNTRSVRAIVIAATLYDSVTRMPIETFVLK